MEETFFSEYVEGTETSWLMTEDELAALIKKIYAKYNVGPQSVLSLTIQAGRPLRVEYHKWEKAKMGRKSSATKDIKWTTILLAPRKWSCKWR